MSVDTTKRYPVMLSKDEIVELLRYGQFPAAFMERLIREWDEGQAGDAE